MWNLSAHQRSTWDCEERNEFTALTFRFSYYRFHSICRIPHAVALDFIFATSMEVHHHYCLWNNCPLNHHISMELLLTCLLSIFPCQNTLYLLHYSISHGEESSCNTVRWSDEKKERFHSFSPEKWQYLYYTFLCKILFWSLTYHLY